LGQSFYSFSTYIHLRLSQLNNCACVESY